MGDPLVIGLSLGIVYPIGFLGLIVLAVRRDDNHGGALTS